MARLFNGTTDLIQVTDAATLRNDDPMTIFGWCYPTGWGDNDHGRLYDKGLHALSLATNEFDFQGTGADNTFGCYVVHDSGGTPNGGQAIAATDTLALNQWWFLAMRFQAADGGCRLYRGSETLAVAEVTYAFRQAESGPRDDDTGQDVWLGNRSLVDRGFAGRLGPIGECNNALTVAQLETLRRFTYTARGRHAWGGLWMLNEPTGAVRDYSGNGNTGAVTGTSWIKSPTITRRPRAVAA